MENYTLETYISQPWIRLIGEGDGPRPLVWLMAGSPEEPYWEELSALLEAVVLQGRCIPLALAGASPASWNDGYSPWPLELSDGRRFGGQAAETMQLTQTQLLPQVHCSYR